jgi:hypothetical protein
VPLGQTIPSTFVGTAAANTQGAFTTFTSPISLVKPPNMVFQVTETDTRTSLSTSQSITIQDAAYTGEVVTVPTVTYRQTVSRVGAPALLGVFHLQANSTAQVAPPAGWTMNATMTAKLANGTTSAPVTIPLNLTAADVPNQVLPVCGATPCWIGDINGLIVDVTGPNGTPTLVAPDTIVVRSSLGGTATILKGDPAYVLR